MNRFFLPILLSAGLAFGALTGCAGAAQGTSADEQAEIPAAEQTVTATTSDAVTAVNYYEGGVLDTTDMFTERDLTQGADLSSATAITVTSGEDVTISQEGVYVLSGDATDATVVVEADDTAKVQLVLDGLNITNTDAAAIYVTSADKVFVTTAEGSTNTLEVTGEFVAVGDDNVDGVIFAKDDICLNGTGTLVINSTANGVVGKDDVKVTGGTYQITAGNHGIQGKDSVRIADGTFAITATTDGIHAENSDDDSLGYVYICGGTFDIDAASDGIEGDAVVQVDGGAVDIVAEEGIEGTYVQLNGGTINIQATDDGINASVKSTSYSPTLEINDGAITVNMGQGDTDALDSNGDLIINGGTVDITAQFAFDFAGTGALNGGTVTVNGEQVTQITESMMGGGMMGGPGGQMPSDMGGQMPSDMGGQMPGGPQGGMR